MSALEFSAPYNNDPETLEAIFTFKDHAGNRIREIYLSGPQEFAGSGRVTEALSLERFLEILRAPRNEREGIYFPPTEFMLLTGLRWGEAAGVCWSDVSLTGGQVHIRRAVVRGEDNLEEPTKTAEKWSIPIRPPLADLLWRQRGRSYLGRAEGRVFPGVEGHARQRGRRVGMPRSGRPRACLVLRGGWP